MESQLQGLLGAMGMQAAQIKDAAYGSVEGTKRIPLKEGMLVYDHNSKRIVRVVMFAAKYYGSKPDFVLVEFNDGLFGRPRSEWVYEGYLYPVLSERKEMSDNEKHEQPTDPKPEPAPAPLPVPDDANPGGNPGGGGH